MRLSLARLLLRAKRPHRAIETLAALDLATLTDVQRAAKSALEGETHASLGGSGLELE